MRVDVHLPEPELNRLLRRVDWRFLLPCPRPRSIACLADGLLRDAVPLITEHVADSSEQGFGQCDLVVVDAPTREKLKHAWHALTAGGYIYCEWSRPQLGGTSAVERELNAAGFADVSCHWAWPAPERGAPLFLVAGSASRRLELFL